MVVTCSDLPRGFLTDKNSTLFLVTTYSCAISQHQTLTPFAIMHAWSPVSSCMCLCVGEWDSEYVQIVSESLGHWLQHCDAIKTNIL